MKRQLFISVVFLICGCAFCNAQDKETRLDVYVSAIDSIHTYLRGGEQIFVSFNDSVPEWTQNVNRSDMIFFCVFDKFGNYPKVIRKRLLAGKSIGFLSMKITEDEQTITIKLSLRFYRLKFCKGYIGVADRFILKYYNVDGLWRLE